jgi:hypothetical protein
MIYYRISPETSDPNGKPLFLTAQQSTRTVAVATLLPNNDPSQLWTPVEYIWGTDQGFVLLNYQTNMVISAPNDNAAVALTNHIDMNRGTWKFQGVNYGALQLQANTDMNLNVAGDGPYPSGTAVLAWDWSDGAPNEVWNFLMVGC